MNAQEKCWAKERTQVGEEQAVFYGEKSDAAADPAKILRSLRHSFITAASAG